MPNTPAKTSRVIRSKKATTVDIDAMLDEEVPGWDTEDVPTVPVTIFGEEFHVYQVVNIFALLSLEDAEDFGALARILTYAVVEDERPRLKSVLSRFPNLKIEVFSTVVKGVMQAASGEVPTKPPSGSGRTRGRKAEITPSAAV